MLKSWWPTCDPIRHDPIVTPLGVKHALTFQSMSISISYMFIITCKISSLDLKCVKHGFEPKWLHLLARVVELV
jgi:hypothetical protein